MNTGMPVIRPMHLSNLNVSMLPLDTINNMYMFGPSILAQPNFEYYGKIYPTSNWCTVYGGLS
jgi:alpha-glucosidase (family GH31 glycosyl hydrolase)